LVIVNCSRGELIDDATLVEAAERLRWKRKWRVIRAA
jgi:phosphoglycerate dehydrogenase-like enzyme